MADLRTRGQTSNLFRMILKNAVTGAAYTGLSSTSTGLRIGTICDNEATATVYAQGSSNVETIATLGTFAAPTLNKCRFQEVDATNHPGLYEIQLPNARFAVVNSLELVVSISGASNLDPVHHRFQLNAPVSTALWAGTTVAVPTVAGVPEVDLVLVNGAITNESTIGPVYEAILYFYQNGATNRYVVVWYKDREPVPVTGVPDLSVYNINTNTEIIAETTMTRIGSLNSYSYSTGVLLADGHQAVATVTATIDSATRTQTLPVGRDS